MCPPWLVSAKTKQGLDELLETVLLVADLKDLKAVYDCPAAGSILGGPPGSRPRPRGHGAGPAGHPAGRRDLRGRRHHGPGPRHVQRPGPEDHGSHALHGRQILGFEEVPVSGDNFQVVEDEAKGRTIVGFRQEKARAAAQMKQRVTLENLFSTLKDGQIKELPLIIKADTSGSVESLVGSLEKLSTDKVRVRIIHAAAGTVNKNDVLLAEASKASIIAFSTKAEREAEELAQEEGVDLRFHEIIYKVTEEITAAMVGLLDAVEKEIHPGPGRGPPAVQGRTRPSIAGSFVTEGKVQKAYRVRVKRGEEVVWDGTLKSLKRFKEDVHEVKNGLDCGISLDGFDDLKEGDVLEFYTREKHAATSL